MTRGYVSVRPGLVAVVALTVLSVGLAGCTKDPEPSLSVRQTAAESMLLLTVDSVSKDFRYGDLLIMIDNEPWHMGAARDAVEHLFEVEGKDQPDDAIALGDVMRVPLTGTFSVELRHLPTGKSLQQLTMSLHDVTAPEAVRLASPTHGASGVSRQAVFSWHAVVDESGVVYELEYWLVNAVGPSAPAVKITDIPGTSFAVTKNDELLPGATYHWHVRAIDGFGNVGDWSGEFEFQTAL